MDNCLQNYKKMTITDGLQGYLMNPLVHSKKIKNKNKKSFLALENVYVCASDTQVFDGAVIVLSLAPMVASTVANGPSSPWDAISLIITLRIWRVKRIIDGEERRKKN